MLTQLKRYALTFGLVLMLVALSGGCAAPTAAPAATQPPAATAAVAATQPTAAPAAPKPAAPPAAPAAKAPTTPQGTLRHAHPIAPTTFNPHQNQANLMETYYQLVYETLVAIGKDLKFEPQLATEWQITDKAITFKLRQGVVFHDGAPFNAQAVIANLNDVKNGTPAPLKGALASVQSVDALDDMTVRLNLSAFDPALLLNLAGFAGMQVSPAALKTADKTPVGTGPWAYNAQDSKTDTNYTFR